MMSLYADVCLTTTDPQLLYDYLNERLEVPGPDYVIFYPRAGTYSLFWEDSRNFEFYWFEDLVLENWDLFSYQVWYDVYGREGPQVMGDAYSPYEWKVGEGFVLKERDRDGIIDVSYRFAKGEF